MKEFLNTVKANIGNFYSLEEVVLSDHKNDDRWSGLDLHCSIEYFADDGISFEIVGYGKFQFTDSNSYFYTWEELEKLFT
jgi:hypothetical protein